MPAAPDDDALRRLLADARHTEPIPVDVASRLDDVLAGLAAPTPDAGSEEHTSELQSH